MNALDVVIVGAGPSGLALGAELKRLGISALILDRLEAGGNTSRALVIHARTLEVLEPLTVTPELLQNGVIVPIFRVRDRSRILVTISFRELDTPYPFTLMCPQDRTEAILLRRPDSALRSVVQEASRRKKSSPLCIRSGQFGVPKSVCFWPVDVPKRDGFGNSRFESDDNRRGEARPS